jgi:hypothetical protein
MSKVLRRLGVLTVALALPMGVNAELSEDTHITRDDHVRLDIDRATFNEFKRFYDAGYPAASIMLQGVSLGMAIDDIVYLSVKSDPARAGEFYDTAVSLLPSLPGWVCRSGTIRDRYANYLTLDQLGSPASINAVANEWFNNNRMLSPFPNWKRGQAHMNASVAELAGLLNAQKYWYQPGGKRLSPLFVSLYRDNNEIVIDGGVGAINQAQQAGKSTLPVVIVYNQDHQRPLSRYSSEATVTEIANEFYNNRIEISPVPEWKDGDFHMQATIDDLKSLLHTTKAAKISAEEMAAAKQEIEASGGTVNDPLLLTLLRTGTGEAWIDNPAMLEVAESMGVSQVPVTLFYEDIDRQPCGAPSSCRQQLCDAAIAAGGAPQICNSGGTASALPTNSARNAVVTSTGQPVT